VWRRNFAICILAANHLGLETAPERRWRGRLSARVKSSQCQNPPSAQPDSKSQARLKIARRGLRIGGWFTNGDCASEAGEALLAANAATKHPGAHPQTSTNPKIGVFDASLRFEVDPEKPRGWKRRYEVEVLKISHCLRLIEGRGRPLQYRVKGRNRQYCCVHASTAGVNKRQEYPPSRKRSLRLRENAGQ
jgi:hypothetical protein